MFAPFWNAKIVALAMTDFGSSIGVGPALRAFAPRLVAARASSDGEIRAVAELSLEQLDAAQRDLADLAGRALEPNAFFEPGFTLAAARHFPPKSRPRFIVVWEKSGAERRMNGFFPIVAARPFFGDGMIRLWLHKQAALATPLVDRDDAIETLMAFLAWVEERSVAAGVVFTRSQAKGRFHDALRRAADRQGRAVKILDFYERAALLRGGDADELLARAGSKRKLNELRRQRRRLDERGRLAFSVHSAPSEIPDAVEEFLALEASGWKAGRGALLSQPSLATFVRSATRMMARDGHCKIMAMRLDDKPVAMAILIESQNRSFYWKIAFDEAYRAQAPGVLLTCEQTRAQLARTDIELTDSCAIANHPMIEKLWPDRIGVCDVAVQLQRGSEKDFLDSCRKERRRRYVRDLAKRAAVRLLGRKVV
ncbi:MAG: GNAT family N-acetyltransferase [Methylocystis sp.]|nr:GNAT family N-acetyltransferase [Methylocystis sp.]